MLSVGIKPGSEAGGLNVRSRLHPGDLLDFRTGEVAVFTFRRPDSPYFGYQLNLRGADPSAGYQVTGARSYTAGKPRRTKGAELQRYQAGIDDLPGSLLITYNTAPPARKQTDNRP